VCKSIKNKKRENSYGKLNQFERAMFWHEQEAKKRKKIFGSGATMDGEFWSIL
jgi:hypothetical protein